MAGSAERRLERERRTIRVMVEMACRGRHGTAGALCDECGALLAYAMERVGKCPYRADKPTCARCPTHCYRAVERAQVRAVMRYAGPRMILRHPWLTARHYADQVARHRDRRHDCDDEESPGR